jgi:nicotinate-nucleotide pyrophosphorylase (carboxylating)
VKLETVAAPFVRLALTEDMGEGDITTQATVPEGSRARARLVAKSKGVLAGLDVARLAFECLDPRVGFEPKLTDGRRFVSGDVIARVEGDARALLSAERTALNFLQHLTGIATLTDEFVHEVRGTGARVLDTRKTSPGIRFLEKYAVRVGGGANHRFGLFDMFLVKDNHARAAGGITAAVERIRASGVEGTIVVEAHTPDEIREACSTNPDRILLDNLGIQELRVGVRIILAHKWADGKRPEIEASGGVTLRSVRAIAEAGVDYISIGALTHSAPAADLSLEFDDGSRTAPSAPPAPPAHAAPDAPAAPPRKPGKKGPS